MPGPNFVFVLSLEGERPLRAVAATLGIAGPPRTATFFAFRLWHRLRDAPGRLIVSRGIVALTIGFVIASGCILSRAAGNGWRGLALTAALILATRFNPL